MSVDRKKANVFSECFQNVSGIPHLSQFHCSTMKNADYIYHTLFLTLTVISLLCIY